MSKIDPGILASKNIVASFSVVVRKRIKETRIKKNIRDKRENAFGYRAIQATEVTEQTNATSGVLF